MPVGIYRYNDHGRHPNERIGFITALKGPDEEVARDFLSRIAAKVVPIMKKHGMDVMSLEEFEPNREFVGRNWNAGENVELVLKSLNGQWLPFNMVQNVMLHELSHIRSMTHGPLFWKTYNILRKEMAVLDSKGYTGEGFYSRPYSLTSSIPTSRPVAENEVPETICGGSWQRTKRRVRRKKTGGRKRKFKGEGLKLGEDEGKRRLLESGKVTVKSKVAKSKRARELRAEAALRRFENTKKEEEEGSETESEEEEDVEEIVDTKPEDEDEEAMRHMVEEMKGLRCGTNTDTAYVVDDTASEESEVEDNPPDTRPDPFISTETTSEPSTTQGTVGTAPKEDEAPTQVISGQVTCKVCTTVHTPPIPICCEACNNVLQPDKLSQDKVWKCTSQGCDGANLGYVNFQDAGRCGICGHRRE